MTTPEQQIAQRWKDGCPYNHEHGPWCDDAESFLSDSKRKDEEIGDLRTQLQLYKQYGGRDVAQVIKAKDEELQAIREVIPMDFLTNRTTVEAVREMTAAGRRLGDKIKEHRANEERKDEEIAGLKYERDFGCVPILAAKDKEINHLEDCNRKLAQSLAAADAALAEARRECEEQARLNGMGAEREAKLMAERDRLAEALEKIRGLRWQERHDGGPEDVTPKERGLLEYCGRVACMAQEALDASPAPKEDRK